MHTNNDPHFRNLVDNALTGIIDNTLEGKILFVNQALARMLEFESPEHNEGGFGLFSIEERMSDLNGSFEIESYPGRGVRAILTAPLEPGQ